MIKAIRCLQTPVVDPYSDKLGFFQWRGEQVVTCGFHVVTPVDR